MESCEMCHSVMEVIAFRVDMHMFGKGTPEVAGGPALRAMTLYENLFSAAKMVAVQKDLVDMSVIELKNELKARNEGLGGNKPCLRRGLHAAIMQDIWAAGEADREEEGLDDR